MTAPRTATQRQRGESCANPDAWEGRAHDCTETTVRVPGGNGLKLAAKVDQWPRQTSLSMCRGTNGASHSAADVYLEGMMTSEQQDKFRKMLTKLADRTAET